PWRRSDGRAVAGTEESTALNVTVPAPQGHRRLTPRRIVVRRAPAATAGRQDGRTSTPCSTWHTRRRGRVRRCVPGYRGQPGRIMRPDRVVRPGRIMRPDRVVRPGRSWRKTYGCKRLGRALPERRTRLVGRAEPVGGAGGGRSAPRAGPGPGGGGGAQRRLAGEPGLAGGCPRFLTGRGAQDRNH